MPGIDPNRWRALSPFLEQALEMPDEERLTWLASLRTEDPALADELHRLLESSRLLASEAFLHVPLGEPFPSSGLAGRSVGAYRLISEIGRGGMGTVWLAERNDGRFERKVAIKFLNISLLGKGGGERFRQEGLILGRLTHPHIAQLIDAGVSDTGQPYLVLEHVSGDDIDRYCDERTLDVHARVRLFLDVLEAVEHAHSRHVVHRDLKPSNVLVRKDGEAKLLDFGIAKLLDIGESGNVPQLTGEAGRVLTPHYAAPEQLTGQQISASTDIFALGVLLYVLLTGRHPTAADTHAPAEFIKAVLETDPVKPSDAALGKTDDSGVAITNAARRGTTPDNLSRALSGDLDIILAKCIKKDPRERYPTVSNLADDLHSYLHSRPVSARPDSFAYRTSKYLRRHKGRVAAAFSIMMLMVIGVGVASRFYSPKSTALPQIKQRRLTANPKDLPVLSAVVSPDGAYLGYTDATGIHLQSLGTDAPVAVALPSELLNAKAKKLFAGWYPDSKRFLVALSQPEMPVSLWSISLTGNGDEKVASIDRLWGSPKVSPDGNTIAYTRVRVQTGARELWLMGSHGESPHLIQTAGPQSSFSGLAWAPGGRRLGYVYFSHSSDAREVSVKSCDLEGRNVTTAVKDLRLDGFVWTTPGRLIYSRTTDPGGTDSDKLFEMRVDEKGVPRGQPRVLTDWSGFAAFDFSSTSNGRHLAFLRGGAHITMSVAQLAPDRVGTLSWEPFNADENVNIPLAWTPDSKQVIFSSKRSDQRLIYRRNIDQKTPAQLVTKSSTMSFYLARLTPNRAALLLEGSPNGRDFALYTAEPSGENVRVLLTFQAFILYWCTGVEANFCVFGDAASATNELVITRFDPGSGEKHEALRIPVEPGTNAHLGGDYFWQLAPDGLTIAIMKRHDNWVKLVPMSGGPTKTIIMKGQSDLGELNWAPDSEALFVSALTPSGASVSRVNLDGAARPVFQDRDADYLGAIPSPDGKRLVIWSNTVEANAWMIDDFDH
ncbi:serine/threonine-protein kinase [Occallatibacter riparius]|uniref:Serine/threonine-protein kinase n=1 Tax=Occallatibacter riparius TaxID=1002689 RepID=A0A9J7BU28_9BACT|nr:serine/threonine-protein kinase [Occallatibacter riparius]UWZ84438.1 serine/threonine-protein kinase [Occallatibacter riparius]